MLTTLALSDYFTDKLFFLYLLNAIGEIHYLLPGVFQDNPKPDIVSVDLMAALSSLHEITGQSASDEVIAAVFRNFCVGK